MNMVILTAWVGVFFLVWRTRIADKQTQISQESHYTELFTKAVEQLGAVREVPGKESEPALETRIGAIYSLERLAKDSERDYGPIIETLATYIREHCRCPKPFNDDGLSGEELRRAQYKWIQSLRKNPPANRSDVAAALTVLSRREKNRNWTSTSEDETQPDFTGANFQGATLWNKSEGLAREGTNLKLIRLDGAILREAIFEDAQLEDAQLIGVDLRKAKLWKAKLHRADLRNANFANAELTDADLWSANLKYARLMNVNLKGANLVGAKFMYANLSNANLRGTQFSEGNKSIFSNALLIKADLRDAKNLTAEMLEKAFGAKNTLLPDGLARPSNWGSQNDAIKKWQKSWGM